MSITAGWPTARWALAAPLLVLLAAATCGDRGPVNERLLVHQRACARNLEIGDLDAAEARCGLCLDFDERNAECLYDLGLVKWQRGDKPAARTLIVRAIRENNDFGQARNALGRMALDDGDVDGAIGYFAGAVEIDPEFREGRYNLALAWLRKAQRQQVRGEDPASSFNNAESEYRKIFEIAPNDVAAAADMGVLLSLRADAAPPDKQRALIADAEAFFARCLQLDPAHKECHGNLAHLLLAVGRDDEAVFHDVQCLAVDPGDPICSADLKRGVAGAALTSSALQRFAELLVAAPGDASAHAAYGQALFDKGLIDLGARESHIALQLNPALCRPHEVLARHAKMTLDAAGVVEHCTAFLRCGHAGSLPGQLTHDESRTAECRAWLAVAAP